MESTVPTQRLSEAIAAASRIVGKKESLPVLSCALLEARTSELVIRATNLESGVEIRLPARVSTPGVCAVPAQTLLSTVRMMRSAEVVLEHEDGVLSFKGGTGTTQIHTIPHEEFPTLPIPAKKTGFSIPLNALCGGIRAVVYAAATSTIRPEFASVSVAHKDERLICAATDSFRLAEKKIPLSTKNDIPDILIPAKNAIDITQLFEKSTVDDANCVVADNQIYIKAGETAFISRVVDATFPHYENIIPKKADTEATLLKEDFMTVLQKARVFAGDTQHVGFHVYPQKKVFTCTAQHAAVGAMADSIDAALKGEDVDVNFNIPLIHDCMQSIAADSIILRFAGPGKPLIIQGVSDASFLYLVMPLNR